jgi:hypothetical protein
MVSDDVKNTTRPDLKGAVGGRKQAPTGDAASKEARRQMLKQVLVDRMKK